MGNLHVCSFREAPGASAGFYLFVWLIFSLVKFNLTTLLSGRNTAVFIFVVLAMVSFFGCGVVVVNCHVKAIAEHRFALNAPQFHTPRA